MYSAEEITGIITRQYAEATPDVLAVMNKWLARGDGIAVYRNRVLDHPGSGTYQFVSFGSPAAQLETDIPPDRLPDIGIQVNWQFTLAGTYRGDTLTPQ